MHDMIGLRRQVWDMYHFDAIIAPALAIPAFPNGLASYAPPFHTRFKQSDPCHFSNFTYIGNTAAATCIYNLVDSPVGHIPVTHVNPAKDALTPHWWSSDDHGSKATEDLLYKGDPALYDPEAIKGLPVGVQVVGRPW